jgi:hypothetical protein
VDSSSPERRFCTTFRSFGVVMLGLPNPEDPTMPDINTLLDANASLQCECLDRIYLNGIPNLQTPGICRDFLSVHPGYPVASAATMPLTSS